MQTTKICTRCKKQNPIDHFTFRNKKTGVRRGYCKACVSEQSLKSYHKNKVLKEKARVKAREYQPPKIGPVMQLEKALQIGARA